MIWFKEMAGDAYDPIWQQIALDLRLKLSTVIAVRSMLYAQAAMGSNSYAGEYILCPDTLDKLLGEKSGTARRVLAQMEVYGYAQDGRLVKWEQAQVEEKTTEKPSGRKLDVTALEWRILRAAVFDRDDYICQYCGQHVDHPHCDHVFPLSRGGKSIMENLVTACPSCNCSKHDRTPEEWRAGQCHSER